MANEPITPARFALALQDLPLSTLALKAAELRNSIAHLDYSNEQLQPFAYPAAGQPSDLDCKEAIQENEGVIKRMEERIELVRQEVERRGASWRELGGLVPPTPTPAPVMNGEAAAESAAINGVAGGAGVGVGPAGLQEGGAESGDGGRHAAWSDGTFQTGTITGGRAVPDRTRGQGQGLGGTLGDDELRRRLEERMRAGAYDEEDAGMHL